MQLSLHLSIAISHLRSAICALTWGWTLWVEREVRIERKVRLGRVDRIERLGRVERVERVERGEREAQRYQRDC